MANEKKFQRNDLSVAKEQFKSFKFQRNDLLGSKRIIQVF